MVDGPAANQAATGAGAGPSAERQQWRASEEDEWLVGGPLSSGPGPCKGGTAPMLRRTDSRQTVSRRPGRRWLRHKRETPARCSCSSGPSAACRELFPSRGALKGIPQPRGRPKPGRTMTCLVKRGGSPLPGRRWNFHLSTSPGLRLPLAPEGTVIGTVGRPDPRRQRTSWKWN